MIYTKPLMSFYIIKQDMDIEGSAAIDGVPDHIDPLEWMQGQVMPAPKEDLILDLSLESGDYRDHIIDGFLTLYRTQLKDELTQLGVDNIDYYPVILRDQETNEVEKAYWLANIIGLLDCVDMDKSTIKWWPSGRGFDFESMVIDPDKTGGAKIFRLKEDPTKVIINEELYQHFIDTNFLVGVELIKTEDYSDW